MAKYSKRVIFASKGVDQLGRQVGLPIPGDVVKLHMSASYAALRPMFKIGGKKFGAVKMREKEFLNTHAVGETAFFEVQIPTSPSSGKEPPQSATAVLVPYVKSMTLGETAEFYVDFESMDEKTKDLFFKEKLHKGQYKSLPTDALKLIIVFDSFRIVRTSDPAKKGRQYGADGAPPAQ